MTQRQQQQHQQQQQEQAQTKKKGYSSHMTGTEKQQIKAKSTKNEASIKTIAIATRNKCGD